MAGKSEKRAPRELINIPVRFYGREPRPDTAEWRAFIIELRELIEAAEEAKKRLLSARRRGRSRKTRRARKA